MSESLKLAKLNFQNFLKQQEKFNKMDLTGQELPVINVVKDSLSFRLEISKTCALISIAESLAKDNPDER